MHSSFSTKSLAIVAVVTLAGGAQACLQITGNGNSGAFGVRVNVKAIDNGNTVCEGGNDSADGYIDCKDGYKLHHHWGAVDGGLGLNYCNIAGNW
jgi:hypothetical protein